MLFGSLLSSCSCRKTLAACCPAGLQTHFFFVVTDCCAEVTPTKTLLQFPSHNALTMLQKMLEQLARKAKALQAAFFRDFLEDCSTLVVGDGDFSFSLLLG